YRVVVSTCLLRLSYMKRVLKRLDSVHEQLVACVTSLEPAVYSEQPADGEWSVGEIVHHLCLVEDRVIKELEGAIAKARRSVPLLRRLIPTSIVSLRAIRVKAPKAVNPLMPPPRDVAIQNFDRARSNLKALCDTHGQERLRNLVFRHPVLGE